MEEFKHKINYNSKIPIHAFDLIISDECHRPIYNKWNIDTKITMEGIVLKGGRAIKVEDEKTKEVFDTRLDDEIDFEPQKIERKITAIDRNRKIVRDFAKYFKENQKTVCPLLFFS